MISTRVTTILKNKIRKQPLLARMWRVRAHIGGNINGVAAMKNSLVLYWNIKIELPYNPAILLLGIYPKWLKVSLEEICTPKFIAALFTEVKRWKQHNWPWMHEWVNKMWNVYSRAYYPPLKRNETLTHATTWMNLEDIVLSEISLTQKDKYCLIPLVYDT